MDLRVDQAPARHDIMTLCLAELESPLNGGTYGSSKIVAFSLVPVSK